LAITSLQLFQKWIISFAPLFLKVDNKFCSYFVATFPKVDNKFCSYFVATFPKVDNKFCYYFVATFPKVDNKFCSTFLKSRLDYKFLVNIWLHLLKGGLEKKIEILFHQTTKDILNTLKQVSKLPNRISK